MSIPLELLEATESMAVGICTYGGPGKKKTLATHTLPPPILLYSFEQGTGSLMPWVRRSRREDGEWTNYSQEDRMKAYELLSREVITLPDGTLEFPTEPSPLIDVITYDNLSYESYDKFILELGNFDVREYNSLAMDSLQEFSVETQTYSKGSGGQYNPMELKLWGGAQERAAIVLRRMRNLRGRGVFVYLIGSEQIDKDYVTDPRSLKAGQSPEQPFAIKATVNVPGKLVEVVSHTIDILLHATTMNGRTTWVSKPMPLPSGNCSWEAKDRFGRLPVYCLPNFRSILAKLYGKDTAKEIYAHAAQIGG